MKHWPAFAVLVAEAAFIVGWIVFADDSTDGWIGVLFTTALPLLLGLGIGRWWAVALPFGVLLILAVIGYVDAQNCLDDPNCYSEDSVYFPFILAGFLLVPMTVCVLIGIAASPRRQARGGRTSGLRPSNASRPKQ
jgi:uncharacterized membrane protein